MYRVPRKLTVKSMEMSESEYTRWYIVQALFRLMHSDGYENVNVSDIARKAGVGRATFYRYFKRKEDVIKYYFERHTREFMFVRRYYPRCREDYIDVVKNVLTVFREQKEPFALIRKARLEYLYLDFLNDGFSAMFAREYPDEFSYAPYLYAGMLFNVSMRWLDDGCAAPTDELARVIVDAIYRDE